jgi:hypothetical protein
VAYTLPVTCPYISNIRLFRREDGKEIRNLEVYFYDNDLSLHHWYRRCREKQYQKDEIIERPVANP